jgi:hypothetical protein
VVRQSDSPRPTPTLTREHVRAAIFKTDARLSQAEARYEKALTTRNLGIIGFAAGTAVMAAAVIILVWHVLAGIIALLLGAVSMATGTATAMRFGERAGDAALETAALNLEMDRLHREQTRLDAAELKAAS